MGQTKVVGVFVVITSLVDRDNSTLLFRQGYYAFGDMVIF